MAIQDKTTLKSFFETGDVPTQAQFADLIDTIFGTMFSEDEIVFGSFGGVTVYRKVINFTPASLGDTTIDSNPYKVLTHNLGVGQYVDFKLIGRNSTVFSSLYDYFVETPDSQSTGSAIIHSFDIANTTQSGSAGIPNTFATNLINLGDGGNGAFPTDGNYTLILYYTKAS